MNTQIYVLVFYETINWFIQFRQRIKCLISFVFLFYRNGLLSNIRWSSGRMFESFVFEWNKTIFSLHYVFKNAYSCLRAKEKYDKQCFCSIMDIDKILSKFEGVVVINTFYQNFSGGLCNDHFYHQF